jgi:hypothetical protein
LIILQKDAMTQLRSDDRRRDQAHQEQANSPKNEGMTEHTAQAIECSKGSQLAEEINQTKAKQVELAAQLWPFSVRQHQNHYAGSYSIN